MRVDGRAFMAADDGINTTLIETTAPGGPRRGPIVRGYVWNVLRVR